MRRWGGFYSLSSPLAMASSSDEALPEQADDRPAAADAREERDAEDGPARSFGAALSAILADQRTGGPTPPPGTLRKRKAEKSKAKELLEARETRRKLLEKDRVVPEASTAAYERRLMKVATRGVVRLFNAVAAQRAAHDADEEEDEESKAKSKAGTSRAPRAALSARSVHALATVPRAGRAPLAPISHQSHPAHSGAPHAHQVPGDAGSARRHGSPCCKLDARRRLSERARRGERAMMEVWRRRSPCDPSAMQSTSNGVRAHRRYRSAPQHYA